MNLPKRIRATKPFRVGMGGGPEHDGLCAVGDAFTLHEDSDDVEWRLVYERDGRHIYHVPQDIEGRYEEIE